MKNVNQDRKSVKYNNKGLKIQSVYYRCHSNICRVSNISIFWKLTNCKQI